MNGNNKIERDARFNYVKKEEFSERLWNLRMAKGWSQKKLAEKIGITQQAYHKYEIQESIPGAERIKALADAFGVTVDYLLNGALKSNTKNELVLEMVDLMKKCTDDKIKLCIKLCKVIVEDK